MSKLTDAVRGVAFVAVVVFSGLAAAQAKDAGAGAHGGMPTPPPLRDIPGITAKDPHPNACVDCHKNLPQMKMDVRLSTLMKGWVEGANPKLMERAQAAAPEGVTLTGKHPKVDSALKSIPKNCLTCHKADSKKAPPFSRLMHEIHLVGGKDNAFLTFYQGDCTHCHKLNQKTGAWSIPSAAEP